MIFIKHVRNKIKTQYQKGEECYICGGDEKLEFHHLICISILAKRILRKERYLDYPTDDDPRFEELVWLVAKHPDMINPSHFYTLCKKDHKRLHDIWGQNYIPYKGVAKYIEKQRALNGN